MTPQIRGAVCMWRWLAVERLCESEDSRGCHIASAQAAIAVRFKLPARSAERAEHLIIERLGFLNIVGEDPDSCAATANYRCRRCRLTMSNVITRRQHLELGLVRIAD